MKPGSARVKTQQGLTWIGFLALVITVAVLGLAAIPNLAATIKSNRDSAQIHVLLSSLQLARRAAMQSSSDVTITPCADAPADSCSTRVWTHGWTVRYLTPPPGAASLIHDFPALGGGNQLSDTADAQIIFRSNGMTNLPGPATFTLCDRRGAHEARAVTLLVSGVAQASETPGKNVDGSALTCHA